jgi:hypothetical protein
LTLIFCSAASNEFAGAGRVGLSLASFGDVTVKEKLLPSAATTFPGKRGQISKNSNRWRRDAHEFTLFLIDVDDQPRINPIRQSYRTALASVRAGAVSAPEFAAIRLRSER